MFHQTNKMIPGKVYRLKAIKGNFITIYNTGIIGSYVSEQKEIIGLYLKEIVYDNFSEFSQFLIKNKIYDLAIPSNTILELLQTD